MSPQDLYPRRVVITGMGAVTPAGIGWKTNWQHVLEGCSGVRPISLFPSKGYRTTIAGEVLSFDPTHYMNEKQADGSERFTQLAVAAARLALEDSHLSLKAGDSDTGVILGCGMGGLPYFETQASQFFRKGPGAVRPGSVPRIMPNAAGAFVASLLNVRGPNLIISTACSSGNNAVGYALDLIRTGRCQRALCGGTESLLSPVTFDAFDALRVMSARNADPGQACRPFDKNRDGFVMGEGAVLLMLEDREQARARGASIYAEVAGYGCSNGTYHILAPDPQGQEASDAMDVALKDAGISPKEVDYIHAHGTGTRSNDQAETAAIKRSLGSHAEKTMVSSTKPITGHMMGAAGAMGVMVCALSIKMGQVPPTMNYQTPDPACDLDYVPQKARKARVRVAISNAFAFGSNNAAVVLRQED